MKKSTLLIATFLVGFCCAPVASIAFAADAPTPSSCANCNCKANECKCAENCTKGSDCKSCAKN